MSLRLPFALALTLVCATFSHAAPWNRDARSPGEQLGAAIALVGSDDEAADKALEKLRRDDKDELLEAYIVYYLGVSRSESDSEAASHLFRLVLDEHPKSPVAVRAAAALAAILAKEGASAEIEALAKKYGESKSDPDTAATLYLEAGRALAEQRDALLPGEQHLLADPRADGDDHAVEQCSAATQDVEVPVRHGIERAGIERGGQGAGF